MMTVLGVLMMSGCQQTKSVVNSNTASNTNTTANSNTATNSNAPTNANANSNVTANSNSNKAETTEKVEKPNPAIVTAEQVNGTWSKGESWIKIKAIGGGKLNVNFSIFNERTTNAGQAEGVATIDGIDATFSPEDFEKCKFTMKFTGGKLIVKQFGTDRDCGFGMGVSADGTYAKK